MMEKNLTINGVKLSVVCDKEEILGRINSLKTKYEYYKFQKPYTFGEGFGYITEKQYIKNLDSIIKILDDVTEDSFLLYLLNDSVKKADGTFNKVKVYERYICENSELINKRGVFHWSYFELIIKPINDTTMVIDFLQHFTRGFR